MSLFDEQDLAEISHPDYPGERLIACRNPALAAERARKRGELLAATEANWPKSPPPPTPGASKTPARSGSAPAKSSAIQDGKHSQLHH